jgi:hypothetical protein
MAQAELDALEPQFLAADFRTERAEQELQLHDTQIEHSKEVFEFAKDRFSNLGLYTYLSTHLSRLHRSAYDMAHKMAVSAERAYRFETGDEKFFLEGDNWDASRAGLLAADRLLLQLQAMEASFLERDRQEHEITLACSLTQIDPDAVVRLRQTGRTNFPLPEWWFDLYYPGQFRRTIRAVRLSIPGVIGPSVNVGARLTLMESAMRITPNSGTAALRAGGTQCLGRHEHRQRRCRRVRAAFRWTKAPTLQRRRRHQLVDARSAEDETRVRLRLDLRRRCPCQLHRHGRWGVSRDRRG